MRNYLFYAVFDYNDNPISVYFPDCPGCFSCGCTTDEAMKMAEEALSLYLDGLDEKEVPRASSLEEIEILKQHIQIIPITVSI